MVAMMTGVGRDEVGEVCFMVMCSFWENLENVVQGVLKSY